MWSFVVGDSRRAPLGVALAVGIAFVLERSVPSRDVWIGAVYVAVIAAGLVASVFEH